MQYSAFFVAGLRWASFEHPGVWHFPPMMIEAVPRISSRRVYSVVGLYEEKRHAEHHVCAETAWKKRRQMKKMFAGRKLWRTSCTCAGSYACIYIYL